MKCMANMNWGADREILLKLYTSLVRSRIDYADIIYTSARRSRLDQLDRIQNSALRIAIGAYRTTPIDSLNADTGIMPLVLRRHIHTLTYPIKCMTDTKHINYNLFLKENEFSKTSDSEEEDCLEQNEEKNESENEESGDNLLDPDWLPEDPEEEYRLSFSRLWENRTVTTAAKKSKLGRSSGKKKKQDLVCDVSPSNSTFQPTYSSCDETTNEQFRIILSEAEFVGKNGCKWKVDYSSSAGKTPASNVVHIRPGLTAPLRKILDPVHAFQTFFSDAIPEKILDHTNQHIEKAQQKYGTQNKTVGKINLQELKAILGLFVLSGALKHNHLSSDLMFNTPFCGTRYRATMSQKRFDFLTSCLRLDDKQTRE
nr:unnamed protein product [Callosobruchus chinensis]